MNFGTCVGALIKSYRTAQGLNAKDLAVEVFQDETKRVRISELENGKVANPRASTIDPIIDNLNIPWEEIDACRKPPSEPKPDAPPDTGLPNDLLENLAQRFGIENPDQPPAARTAFLKEKAKDYKKLKSDMAELPSGNERTTNVRAAAEEAIGRGDFEEARARLDDAIEIEVRDHALVSAIKAADLLDLKGKSHLLEGDAELAAEQFQRGAEMVKPFDIDEFAKRRHNTGIEFYDHGLRYGGKSLAFAISAYEAALEVRTRADHPVDWAMTQNNLAVALYSQGKRLGGEEGVALLGRSVSAYEAALEVRTRADHPVQWAMTQNNLAVALRSQGEHLGGEEGVALLGRSVSAYESALEVRTRADHPVDWAMTQNNLAVALYSQGKRLGGEEGVALLGRSVSAYEAALEVRTRADHPVDWAATQNNLAVALRSLGEHLGGEEGVALLGRSVSAYESALEVRTRADHPVDWAMTQENIAIAYESMAELDLDNVSGHLQQALVHVELCLEIFDPTHMAFNFEKASSLQKWIEAKLVALE